MLQRKDAEHGSTDTTPRGEQYRREAAKALPALPSALDHLEARVVPPR